VLPPGKCAVRAPSSFLRTLCVASFLTFFVSCAPGAPTACTLHDLAGFTICAPPTWTLVKGGTDSAAGHFQDGALRVDYDFGLYSDPLAVPAGATGVTGEPVTIDGHTASRVTYTRPTTPPTYCLGVHVSGVAKVSMGQLKLTILASTPKAEQLQALDAVVATVRFKPL
jgi:hypothetical protein